MSPINLDRIQSWIDQGRLDPSRPITMKELNQSRCLHGVKRHGVKLLAKVCLCRISSHFRTALSSYERSSSGSATYNKCMRFAVKICHAASLAASLAPDPSASSYAYL
jgi:hypothetical protein